MSLKKRILVTGAGGFIGHNLVNFLKKQNYIVRGVDIKEPEYEKTQADEFLKLDLKIEGNAFQATKDVDEVYALASDMGGMGYISFHDALILQGNLLINANTIEAAKKNGVKKYFFSSSACVYPEFKQNETEAEPLQESDAFPAQPQDAYGWEKLVTELMCKYYKKDYNLEVRVARFHNIFGPLGTWRGGREKAPAALCRKIALAKLTNNPVIEIWGDGEQTRSFCYIDDCVEGIYRLMNSDYSEAVNIGQDQLISINQLADLIAKIADFKIEKKHISGPQGVRGRNSDNTLLKKVLDWQPSISLEEGLTRTYNWIEHEVNLHLQELT